MAFKPKNEQPDFSKLQISLLNAQIQTKNNALYQTIAGLIKKTEKARDLVVSGIAAADTIINSIVDATVLTVEDETITFPNSRQLLAGSAVTFDDSVAAQRTITVIDSFLLMGG